MAELSNARWEKFAQGLASGLSQRAAYRVAFPSSVGWKDATVDKRASELYQNGEIKGRYKELGEMATSEHVMDATHRKEWLTDVMLNEAEETRDKLKACDILNRMDGAYISTVDVNGAIPVVIAGADDLED